MVINSKYFGNVEAEEKDIITFVKPILGFEDYAHFIMLLDDEVGDGFAWLQSVEEPELCFVLANPKLLKFDYDPEIPSDCLEALDGEITEKWLMAVIKDNFDETTVNLKSPLIMNMKNFTGAQAVSESKFPIRYELFSGKELD